MPGIDSYTKLMLHMNGTDASTTFTDSSLSPKTVTANGNAQIDTAQSKFGGASGLFDGTGDYLSTPNSADFDFGSGDFTIDFWMRISSNPTDYVSFLNRRVDDNNQIRFLWFGNDVSGGGRLFFRVLDGGVTTTASTSGYNFIPSHDAWHHIAVVRTGNTIKFFVDGTQFAVDYTFNITIPSLNATTLISVDTNGGTSQYYLNGWLDEYRVSKGIARWTSDFTPPTEEYAETPTATGRSQVIFM
jgi:hypothetical protein